MSDLRNIAFMLALFVVVSPGCTRNTKQAFAPNFGSSLVAVHQAIESVVAYHGQHGAFPFHTGALTNLEAFGLSPDAAILVQLLNTNATPVTLKTNTVCVIAITTVEDEKLGTCRYAGLLSGEVVLAPVAEAILGKEIRNDYSSVRSRMR